MTSSKIRLNSNNRNWKHIFAFFMVSAFVFTSLQAQSNSFFIGVNGGTNFSKFKFTEDLAELYPNSTSLAGLNGGVTVGFQIQNFTLKSGLQYIQKGSHYETNNFVGEEGTGFFSANERLHYLSIPVTLGYRFPLTHNFGVSIDMGPSFNMGMSGKIDESIEYYGVEEISKEHHTVAFGSGVNDDYDNVQVGFQISPGLYYDINDRSKVTFNVTWDNGLGDSYNARYKQANEFFDDYKGNQFNRSTVLTIGYEYHFNFSDKY